MLATINTPKVQAPFGVSLLYLNRKQSILMFKEYLPMNILKE
jgi:hypothetical protein